MGTGRWTQVTGRGDVREQSGQHLGEHARILGLDEVVFLDVAVAEVVADLDVHGDGRGLPKGPLENTDQDLLVRVAEPRGDLVAANLRPLEHAEFECRVPLDGELVVRDPVEDAGELGEERALVDRLHDLPILLAEEAAHHTGGRGERDLEPRPGGNDAPRLQVGEDAVGVERGVRVAEARKPQLVGRYGPVHRDLATVEPVTDVERGIADAGKARGEIEVVLLELDPVVAIPHLAVGNPLQAAAKAFTDHRERRGGVGQVDAADEVGETLTH